VPVGENPLVNAFMTTENTMVVFGTYSDFTASSNGLSKVFKGYLPQIFSPSTNTVLDICGNTNMWGNLFINETRISLETKRCTASSPATRAP
jgi:hypothetical protein